MKLTAKLFCLSIILCTTSIPNNILAEPYSEPDKFDASNNLWTQVNVTWETTKDVQKACNKKSFEFGNNGFDIQVEACSFHNERNGQRYCYIITSEHTTMSTVGHELRHCFQIHFHEDDVN